MISKPRSATSLLGFLVPTGALAFYGVIQFLGSSAQGAEPRLVVSLLILPVLLATVIAAVLHAEEIAHELGEPYGTLVLTIAVTIIEVALIMSITLSGKGDPALARDTVFSVIMIVCNGIVGLCVLAGGLQYREQDFEVKGASAYLAVLTALSVLTLFLPNFTHSSTGPTLSPAQLAFVLVASQPPHAFSLHRDDQTPGSFTQVCADPNDLRRQQSGGALRTPGALLIASLLAVVFLSKMFASVKAGLPMQGCSALSGSWLRCSISSIKRRRPSSGLDQPVSAQRQPRAWSSLATMGSTVPAVAVIALYSYQSLVANSTAKAWCSCS